MKQTAKEFKLNCTLDGNQYLLLEYILQQVTKCMDYDPDVDAYTDRGEFIMFLNEAEYEMLNELMVIFST